MATWPASLPQRFLDAGYSAQPRDNVLRSDMDVGPAKTRLRATATPYRVGARMIMTKAQYATFLTFYEDTIFYGTVSFDLADAGGTTRSFYIQSYSASLIDHYYLVDFQLEYTP